jgi:crotonobetainyl-CoA:carnitine CoA-transferase CaiB-like acyl-CoA transferase
LKIDSASRRPHLPAPLAPYRVLDLTDERGQLCGQMLADLGADVILIEPPGGCPSRTRPPFWKGEPCANNSLRFWAHNRNKRSVVLDPANEADRTAFRRLALGADVLLASPGTPRFWDIYDELAAINPRLVVVSISAFGLAGPKSQWAATDLTAWASSHALCLTGDDDRAPVQVWPPQAFLHASSEAALAALVALIARERDGVGQHVDVSAQVAAAAATQSFILMAAWDQTQELARVAGGLRAGPLVIRIVYPCLDGHVTVTFLFGNIIGPFTRRLFEWMHEEGFVDEATRDKDWVEFFNLLVTGREPFSELNRCTAAIEAFTRTKTKAELFAASLERGLLIVPVSTTADVVASRQLAARDYWETVNHGGFVGGITYPGAFAKLSTTPISYRLPPPGPGEHNSEVLDDLPGKAEAAEAVPQSNTAARPPLEGLKVVDLAWVVAGPTIGRYLADCGATVVRVESGLKPDALRGGGPFKDAIPGPERSANFANYNAGKLALQLNLQVPEAREVLLRLVVWADAIIESYAPGAMARMKLGYEDLRRVNPNLIMLSSCLNGQTGPEAHLAGFGTMGAALAGFGEVTGWPDRPPAAPFLAYTDYVSPRFAAAALLAAVDHRRRTGEGQYIDVSQIESSIHLLTLPVLELTANGTVATRRGNSSPDCAPHGVYPCSGDDRWVAIVADGEDAWRSLCRTAGHEEWASDPRFAHNEDRVRNYEALDELVGSWTANLSAEEIEQALQGADPPVAAHRVSRSADFVADPQLAARSHFVEVEHPDLGPVVLEGPKFLMSRTPTVGPTKAMTFGCDNDYVLRDLLGMTDEEIVQLAVAGALE